MKKLSSISMPDFRRIPTPNILTAKDPSAFIDNSSGRYYTMTPKHLDKLYKSIGMKDFRFVKALHEFDSLYCLSSIQRLLAKTPYFLYEGETEIYAYSKESYENIVYLMGEMGKFSEIYSHESSTRGTDSYLGLIDGLGIFVQLSHLSETLYVYDAEVVEDRLYIAKNANISLQDKDFKEVFSFIIGSMNRASLIFKDFVDTKLSWEEVRHIFKLLKIKSGTGIFPLIDDGGISPSQQRHTLSDFSVSDAFLWIWAKIADPKAIGVPYIYDKILSRQIFALIFETV